MKKENLIIIIKNEARYLNKKIEAFSSLAVSSLGDNGGETEESRVYRELESLYERSFESLSEYAKNVFDINL